MAGRLVARLNAMAAAAGASQELAVVLPMDGFHLSKAQLDALPDPVAAHARRGAPWTFDCDGFLEAVRQARRELATDVLAPSFDHAVGDPVAGAIVVRPCHRVVVVEGNYLLLDAEPWRLIRRELTEAWLLDVNLERAMYRIVNRHMAAWGSTRLEAAARADANDALNARLVIEGAAAQPAVLRIPSFDEA
jgi:pantothenate kinase